MTVVTTIHGMKPAPEVCIAIEHVVAPVLVAGGNNSGSHLIFCRLKTLAPPIKLPSGPAKSQWIVARSPVSLVISPRACGVQPLMAPMVRQNVELYRTRLPTENLVLVMISSR